MPYLLTKTNEKYLAPYLKVLQMSVDRGIGVVELGTNNPRALEYILRSAANTKYPELKSWRFIVRDNKIIAKNKNPGPLPKELELEMELRDENITRIDDYMDYMGIANLLISEKPVRVLFTNAYVTDNEYEKLARACDKLEYKVERVDNSTIRVYK